VELRLMAGLVLRCRASFLVRVVKAATVVIVEAVAEVEADVEVDEEVAGVVESRLTEARWPSPCLESTK
jgi:hypothetical protein